MKKATLVFIFLIVIVVGAYLFWTNFSLIKGLFGYNVPDFKDPEIVFPNKDEELLFLDLPNGLNISRVASGLDNPRVLLFDSKKRLLVSETKSGRVSTLLDVDGDGVFESKKVLIDNLRLPHGLDFWTDSTNRTYLYIAETHQVVRYLYDINTGELVEKTGQNVAHLPAEGGHFTRTIVFGPNLRTTPVLPGKRGQDTLVANKLYIS